MTEILQELDRHILEDFALLFRDPLLNFTDSSWNAWEHHMVSPISMPNKIATFVKHLRPNAVLPVIHTWYSRRLGLLCVDELAAVSAHQFPFTPGRQAEEVLFAIREVFQGNCHRRCLPLLIKFGSLRDHQKNSNACSVDGRRHSTSMAYAE